MKNFVLQPPEIQEVQGDIIFLAGPIQDARDWQSEASSIIHDLDSEIVIASPRKIYETGSFVYEKQVDWETHYLERAAKMGAIMFWLARQESQTLEGDKKFPRSYAQTTRQELGEWRNEKKHRPEINLVVGIEDGFGNERYIRRRLRQVCPDVPVLGNLTETCEAAVSLIKK